MAVSNGSVIALSGFITILILLTFVGKSLYYYFYPNETVDNLIANASLRNDINLSGLNGFDGVNGNLGDIAVNGLNGKNGEKGEHGYNGLKSIVVGRKGYQGHSGISGPQGVSGVSGAQGEPSNSFVPFVSYYQNDNDNLVPVTFEHNFTYNDAVHKLTASFLFEDITYFSFRHGLNNVKFEIDTSSSNWHNIPIGMNFGRARKVYSSLRIILEKRIEGLKSDGVIFYASAPISRKGYLMTSNSDLGSYSTGTNRLDEIVIDLNRDFGLDFSTIKATNIVYNYLLNGIARYKVIFNIDPPILGVKPRIEEQISANPIVNFYIPNIKTQTKRGIIKIKNQADGANEAEDIYMLSPSFNFGKVIQKDSSESFSIWKENNFNTLDDSVSKDEPLLVQAFNFLEKDNLTFGDNSIKGKKILISEIFELTVIKNIAVRLRNKDPEDLSGYRSGSALPSGYALYSTKGFINNLTIMFPNTNSPLSYPTELKSATLYMKFYIRVLLQEVKTRSFDVYLLTPPPPPLSSNPPIRIYNTNSFVLEAVDRSTPSLDSSLSYIIDHEYIYYPVVINIDNSNLDFEHFYGRRIYLKLSDSSLNFVSHIGEESEYNDNPGTRFTNHPAADIETGSSNYDFLNSANNIHGFDIYFSTNNIEVVNSNFLIGYKIPSDNVRFQLVIGNRQNNGDYMIDIPLTGYLRTGA